MSCRHCRWAGGGPEQTDFVATTALIRNSPETVSRFVLTSSVGVDRSGQLPFSILNLFGMLTLANLRTAKLNAALYSILKVWFPLLYCKLNSCIWYHFTMATAISLLARYNRTCRRQKGVLLELSSILQIHHMQQLHRTICEQLESTVSEATLI